MCNLKIIKASNKHSRKIWTWRNDPLSSEMSKMQNKISFEDHSFWFKNILLDETKKIYVGEELNVPLGVIRFEQSINDSKAYNISINVAPVIRGKGFGKRFLNKSIEIFKKEENKCRYLFAYIKKKNISSQKLFESCGFLNLSKEDIFTYRYDLFE